MKSTSFQALVVGVLCLCTSGLAAVAVNQHRQLQALQAKPQNEITVSEYQRQWSELNDKQGLADTAIAQLRSTLSKLASTQTEHGEQTVQLASDIESLRVANQAPAANVDLQPLELRLSLIEEQLAQVRLQAAPQPKARPASVSSKSPAVPRPQPPTPPFSIMGSELRGPERFLSLLPLGDRTLSSVRLIQTGETFGGWQLNNLNTSTAVFLIAGQAQTLPIP
jgi:hypothetical protein